MLKKHQLTPEKQDARKAYFREYNANRRDSLNQYMKEHQSTPEGVLKRIYSTQLYHSRKRGHQPPSYTWKDLVEQYINNPEYLALYQGWVESGMTRWTKPSLDRIDESKGYSLDNIQLTTWKQNFDRQANSLKKPMLVQKNGVVVGVFESLNAAAKAIGANRNNVSKAAKYESLIKGCRVSYVEKNLGKAI